MTYSTTRRQLLRGGTAVASVGIAGCLAGLDSAGGGDDADDGSADGGTFSPTPAVVTPVPEPNYGGWLDGVDNYYGATADLRGADAVTVPVGGTGEKPFRFVPAAAMIAPGTVVRFAWVNDGHTITVESQPEASDWTGHDTVEAAGFAHEHTFETAGVYRYYCTPHEALGMRAAIAVRAGPTPVAVRLLDGEGRTRALYGPRYVEDVSEVTDTRQGPSIIQTLTPAGRTVVQRRLRLAGALSDPDSVAVAVVYRGETETEFDLSPGLASEIRNGEWEGQLRFTLEDAAAARQLRRALVGDDDG